jgi:chloramphenicol-sensitive protein RarD
MKSDFGAGSFLLIDNHSAQIRMKGRSMTESTKGILAMIVACTVWGLSPIYYVQLTHVPPLEILCYRGLWSLAFFTLILLFQHRLSEVIAALANPRQVLRIFCGAVMISTNWFGYIYAISTAQGMEASLGYFIFPLVAVLLGRIVFQERLSTMQAVAVGLATVAVIVLTVGLGVAPWIALLLAATFGMYGLIKKSLPVGPVVSVAVEVLTLAPLAIAWLVFAGTGAGSDNAVGTHILLGLSGPLTAGPLILFGFAARRARLSTIGLVQYLNPTLQFLCAAVIFAEPFTQWHAIAFPVIWIALVIYSVSAWRQDRAERRVVSNAATSGTVEM